MVHAIEVTEPIIKSIRMLEATEPIIKSIHGACNNYTCQTYSISFKYTDLFKTHKVH